MTIPKKKAKTVALRDVKAEDRLELELKQHYGIPTPTQEMELDHLIDWVAVMAQDKRDWGWIRREVLRRFAELRRQFTRQQKNYDELWTAHYKDLDRLEAELADVKQTWAQGEQGHLDTVAGLEMQLAKLEDEARKQQMRIVELEEDNARAHAELLKD